MKRRVTVHMLPSTDALSTLCGRSTRGSKPPPEDAERDWCAACEQNAGEDTAHEIRVLLDGPLRSMT